MYEVFASLLREKNVKAAEVARATNMNATVFSDWKKGKSRPKADKLAKIAEYFGVSVNYLLTGDESLRDTVTEMKTEEDPELKELFSIAMKASPEERKQFIKIAKAIIGED